MSVRNPHPITIVQMGHVEKIVEKEQNRPVVQQQVTHEHAGRTIRKREIDPSEASEKMKGKLKTKVDKDGQNKQAFSGKQKHKKKKDESEPSAPDSPMAGIFINKKI